MSATVTHIHFRHPGGEQTARGRDAWALSELIKAGPKGCTPITHPGPRWSAYVHKWRKRGLTIETIHETHGGPFSGHHARYVLRSPVEVLEVRDAA
jgi:winged helix domain-containing protein